ncbi:MAG: TonB-dependent receptor [Bacteroidales bacterium]|nr:TonB-dependent receptor [Bacteroidales bacterium]
MKTKPIDYMAKKLLIVILLLMNVSFIFAQTKIVTGMVTDEFGAPLPGASVVIAGTQDGVASDANGKYSIEVSENDQLTFSFVGMVEQTVSIGSGNIYDVTLIESAVGIEDVVVIGYGTVRKKDLTGAVSVIDTDQIENRRSSDLAGSIKGLAAGVKVTSGGMAGGESSVIIRGIGNLTNNAPLYIVDGVPSNAGLTINMADIESIQILKDASSAAIYGSRAANGVIIVTTKQGHEGPLKVEYSGQVSYNWLPEHDLLSREEWVKFDDMAYDNAIEAGIATKRQSHFPYSTDWQEELFKPGMKHNHNISLSGGNKNGQYYVSYNKMYDEGTLYGMFYDRNSFRVNSSGKKGVFSYGQNLRFVDNSWDGYAGSPFAEVIAISPTIPVYDPNNHGGFGFGDPDSCNTYALNPIARQEIEGRAIRNTYLSGNVYGQIELLKLFTYKVNVGYTTNWGVTDILRKSGSWTMGQADDPSYLTKQINRFGGFLLENTLDFKKTFKNHKIEALAGITYQDERPEDLNSTKYDPLVVGEKYYMTLNSATGDAMSGGGYGESALLSYFGRVSYIYADKYILNFTVRRDGTSRLPIENRWGNFPSISGAWRISKEDFFNVQFISDLKIRANYGILGNSNIGYWDYIAVMNTAPRAVFGIPEHMDLGVIQSKLVNRNITWEKQIQTNIGLDIAFFENKFTMSAEYFISESRDLLVALPILATTGNNGGNPIVNAASLENKGLELDFHWREKVGDLSYGTSLNFSRIRNKVLDLGYGKTEHYTYLSKTEIGQPLGSFYLYKMLGIFDTDEEIQAHVNSEGIVIQPDAVPGDIKYDDYDDNGDISSTDRQIVGSPWPKFETGVSLFANWKGFDVNILGHGRFGQMIWNGSRATAGDFTQSQNNFVTLNPWTETNMDTDQPRLVFGDTRNSRGDQDRWLEDGSFFRISEIAFGYTVPETIIQKVKMDKLRLGISFNNLITFTNYKGLDPDFYDNGIFTISADNNAYPNTRSVMASLTIGF